MKAWLRAYWPHLFGSAVAAVVGVPAAVASYLHGISVIERSGNPDTAAWLPMTTDGLLVASLVALWVRRLTGRKTGRWHWAAFGLGLVATTLTNVAGARPYIERGTGWDAVEAVGWAVWPPICLAVVLEIVAWMVVPDVQAAGRLTSAELAELEESAGVQVIPSEGDRATYLYRFLGEDGGLLYGGITWWLGLRIAKHRREQPWWSEVVQVSVTTYANRFDALEAEVSMIETERPKYNQVPGKVQDAASGFRPVGYVASGPVHQAGPVPIGGLTAAGQEADQVTDDDLIERLREWADREGSVPSRERVRVEYGIGTRRADRVRTAVLTTRDDIETPGPRLVATAETDSVREA